MINTIKKNQTKLIPKTCHNRWMSDKYKEKLVSVIIPTYNREELIQDAIQSVRNQTYRPLELLIIDDGSTDNTRSVIDRFKSQTEQDREITIRYLFQKQKGAQAARNLGLIESQGEYIQFLDSDDILISQKIEWGVDQLKINSCSLVYFLTQETDRDLKPIPHHFCGKNSSQWHNDVIDYLWHTSAPLYRRSVVKEIGPWLENLSGSQDWEYGARIKLYKYQSLYDNRVGSLFRDHQNHRISVSKFDYKYTHSAELAYDYILNLARQLNYLDTKLGSRFVRLYLTRALEFHQANYYQERDRCLRKALELPSSKNLVWFITYLCQILPNKFLLNSINKALVMRRTIK
ncbi:conserved hypothetical protein [Hyella patelloides LEGE 07179]|uniref:Glycosyltransferase 2-like domain-containing protein n=1 Tax=Hyella patelloides LEGE 07179 TaxID=945734 RepID=A0A563VLN8_9CYAN|nr:glycosyltransferase family 2 protein [Hyella patelloides]VEP12243.1 conserved hypothetical protein [Hyella patelloides LEGE 07179]